MTSSGNKPLFLVKGSSMVPLLQTGDQVDLRPIARKEAQIGDIIVFTAANGIQVIHRVICTNPLQTRGDNRTGDDPPVPAESPVFHAVAFIRNGIRKELTSGQAGRREFRRNQRRCFAIHRIRMIVAPVLRRNPFKYRSKA